MSKEESATSDTLLPAVLAGLGALFVSMLVGVAFSTVSNEVGLENVAIVYVAVVAVAAIAGGTSGGLMAALGASLSYNFFFTTPYHTLRIDSFEQVVTVALLFAAGVLISFATNATRGRLFDSDADALPPPSLRDDAVELLKAVAHARVTGTDAGGVAVQGLQRLYDAEWAALIPFDDAPDRSVVWAGDPPTLDEFSVKRTVARDGLRRRDRQRSGTGAMAHVFVDEQHPAVLVVMPRPGQPLTHGMQTGVLAVAQTLEADVIRSPGNSREG